MIAEPTEFIISAPRGIRVRDEKWLPNRPDLLVTKWLPDRPDLL